MKHVLKGSLVVLALAAGTRFASGATFAVTPAAVSNTYSGVLTLNIGGLTNHEPVTVQSYFDVNNNGTVDAGDFLFDTFNISEGGVTTIGGITNLNIPFDSNSATDAITTTLNLTASLDSAVGQRIFCVSSPSGRFTPVTNLFNVTNAALNQAVMGTVYAGGVPQPGTLVAALGLPNFNFAGGAMTDGSGNYFLKLAPGSYALMPVKPGFFTDQSLVPMVALTGGMTATNNLYITNGSVSVSGLIHDSANSNGLGGVFVQFESGNLFTVAFSDASGNYTAGVSPNLWNLKLDGDRLARRGYVRPQGSAAQADTTLGSASNVNVALTRGNAMFYGRLTDGLGAPMANIAIGASAFGNQLEGQGFTDANGYYSVAVLVDTNNFPGSDVWRVSPNSENVALVNYIVSNSGDITLANGQAYHQNFGVLPVTATISGRLLNNLGNPVSGVSVGAYAVIGGTQYSTPFVDTDSNGNYLLGVASGQWTVNANCCGNEGLDSQGYYDPVMQHFVSVPPTNGVVDITVYPIGTPYLSQPQRFGTAQFSFVLSGAAGNNYTIQAKTDFASTNWFTVMVISNMPGTYYFFQDYSATNSQRYYRALLGP